MNIVPFLIVWAVGSQEPDVRISSIFCTESKPTQMAQWCHDLTHFDRDFRIVESKAVSPRLIAVPPDFRGAEVVRLSYALGNFDPLNQALPAISLPTFTLQGRCAFHRILQKIDFPYTKRLNNYAKLPWEDTFAEGGVDREILRQYQQNALKIVSELDDYPKKYPQDVFFSTKAKIYALLLRSHWDFDAQKVLHQWEKLEKEFRKTRNDANVCTCMWYRALLLAQEQHYSQARELYSQITKEYSKCYRLHSFVWWAKQISTQQREITLISKFFFYTPIRQLLPSTELETKNSVAE